ncbi:unnamed protein product [Closterium sp. Naga37s-1]|nr:unnamed protein product [Closterium sp. Naga37s-1]
MNASSYVAGTPCSEWRGGGGERGGGVEAVGNGAGERKGRGKRKVGIGMEGGGGEMATGIEGDDDNMCHSFPLPPARPAPFPSIGPRVPLICPLLTPPPLFSPPTLTALPAPASYVGGINSFQHALRGPLGLLPLPQATPLLPRGLPRGGPITVPASSAASFRISLVSASAPLSFDFLPFLRAGAGDGIGALYSRSCFPTVVASARFDSRGGKIRHLSSSSGRRPASFLTVFYRAAALFGFRQALFSQFIFESRVRVACDAPGRHEAKRNRLERQAAG